MRQISASGTASAGQDEGRQDGPRMRILVVHQEQLVHLGFRALLGRLPWVERCLWAVTAEEVSDNCRRYEPHVAVVEIDRDLASGLATCRDIRARSPRTRTLLLGSVPPPLKAMRSAGAAGFVARTADVRAMTRALRDVAAGRTVLPAERSRPDVLLPRERDVLEHIARGATNCEIASALFVHPDTVKRHTRSAFRKLGARNRAQAVGVAHRLGVLS